MPVKSGSVKVARAEREADMLRLRARGHTYRAIGAKYGVGEARACQIIMGALRRTAQLAADDLRKLELEKLDALERSATRQLYMDHVTVSHGKVIADVVDEAPKLAALDRLLRIQERRAKLLGLDAPSKVEVITTDALDAEIANLESQLASNDREKV